MLDLERRLGERQYLVHQRDFVISWSLVWFFSPLRVWVLWWCTSHRWCLHPRRPGSIGVSSRVLVINSIVVMTHLWVLSSANLPYNFIVILRPPLHLQVIYDCNSESGYSLWKSWVVLTIFVPWRTELSIHISVNSSHWLCRSPTHRREVSRFIRKNWNRDHYPADDDLESRSAQNSLPRRVFHWYFVLTVVVGHLITKWWVTKRWTSTQ